MKRKKMKSRLFVIFVFVMGMSLSWSNSAYAEDILEIEATELQSNVPPPPDFAQVTRLKTLDKAIKIELDESFVPKIISSMKKEPF